MTRPTRVGQSKPQAGRSTAISAKSLSAETWPDFEALFGKHKGVRGGCWCTYHRCSSSEYQRLGRDGRHAYQASLARTGQGHGLIFYDAGSPIAWCQVGPADGFPRYGRSKLYAEHALPEGSKPLWRITCLFVDKDRRGEGLSRVILKGALDHIRKQGGGIVEVFPLDVPGVSRPQYSGTVQLYEAIGFQRVAKLGTNTVLMRRTIAAERR